MNAIQVRKVNVPLTPNLEDYKQKNKSKSRRKPCSIQPTNPPTPKMHKPHIHLKPTHEKHLDPKQPPAFSAPHSDKTAARFMQLPQKKKATNTFGYLSNAQEYKEQEVQTYKKKELDDFRKTIKTFGLKLEDSESALKSIAKMSEERFLQRKVLIQDSFSDLQDQLEQKKCQLLGLLIECQGTVKEHLSDRWKGMDEMRSGICRYLQDIENNYEQIIEDLSFDQFEDIMEKYHKKIIHFQKNIQHSLKEITMNVYLPIKEIERLISKSHVCLFPQFDPQEAMTHTFQNKTLNRYPTEKANFYNDSSKHMTSQAHESLNKMAQHRQSRDRDYFNHYRPNKQNFNLDNITNFM